MTSPGSFEEAATSRSDYLEQLLDQVDRLATLTRTR